MDAPDAAEVAEKFLAEKSLQELYDTMIIPALVLAGQDQQRGLLDEDKHRFILQNIRLLVEDLAHYDETSKRRNDDSDQETIPETRDASVPFTICLAAEEPADEIAAVMLAQLLEQKGINASIVPASEAPAGKLVLPVGKTCLVCIPAVLPAGLLPARKMYRRLGGEFPDLKIVAGLLGGKNTAMESQNCFPKILPENLVTSLKQTIERILQLCYPAGVKTKTAVPVSA